jgi:hypothetical protein
MTRAEVTSSILQDCLRAQMVAARADRDKVCSRTKTRQPLSGASPSDNLGLLPSVTGLACSSPFTPQPKHTLSLSLSLFLSLSLSHSLTLISVLLLPLSRAGFLGCFWTERSVCCQRSKTATATTIKETLDLTYRYQATLSRWSLDILAFDSIQSFCSSQTT